MVNTPSDQTIKSLRASLDELYGAMEKDPTASIPWAVHKHIEQVEGMIRARESPGGTDKILATADGSANSNGWKPGSKIDRFLYYVSQHPNSENKDVVVYVGGTVQQLYAVIASARNHGYISSQPGKLEVTDDGRKHLEDLRNNRRPVNHSEDLRSALGSYLAGMEGKGELDYTDIYPGLHGYATGRVRTMLSQFKSGHITMPGYRAVGGRGKIIVEKTDDWKPGNIHVLHYDSSIAGKAA